jgi:hypothetical protein
MIEETATPARFSGSRAIAARSAHDVFLSCDRKPDEIFPLA